jgi:hypothetical protein
MAMSPGSAGRRENAAPRPENEAPCIDGYRFPKRQGKLNSANSRNSRETRVSAISRRAAPNARLRRIHRDT